MFQFGERLKTEPTLFLFMKTVRRIYLITKIDILLPPLKKSVLLKLGFCRNRYFNDLLKKSFLFLEKHGKTGYRVGDLSFSLLF